MSLNKSKQFDASMKEAEAIREQRMAKQKEIDIRQTKEQIKEWNKILKEMKESGDTKTMKIVQENISKLKMSLGWLEEDLRKLKDRRAPRSGVNELTIPLKSGEIVVERYDGKWEMEWGKGYYDVAIALVRTDDFHRPYKVIIMNPAGPGTAPIISEFAGLMSAWEFYGRHKQRLWQSDIRRLTKKGYEEHVNPEM